MKRIILTENLNYQEWLDLRKTGIGGSDAAIIMGKNPFKSILELWDEKTGHKSVNSDESEATYWGKKLENVVRSEFSERTGLHVYIEPYLLQHDEYPFMQANIDGFLYDSVYGQCIFEAKTASAYKASDWEYGVPQEYYAQLQHYMAVTGYQGAYIAALIGGNKFVWKFVERDNDYIRELIDAEMHFWSNVNSKTQPSIDGTKATEEYLDTLYAYADNKEVLQLDEENKYWIELYLEAKQAEKDLQEIKGLAENQLKSLLQNHERAVIDNLEVVWKDIVSEKFDSKQMKINEPEMYDQYTYKVRYRKFSIKESKAVATNAK